ncbi:hypothetical protein HCN44_003261 [Aphidius gifuensis]|uniref:Sepiapterin reductase n=1 Tax=Aphidius gifuensis TaxID=684658 RepID=A0A835CLN0_APHGI|nr:sepiapterin reductase-like [Aphidius gifuensis]KAF7987499.1 hypothetical protein HCN44_003261 [Aphidius gifuensis]
MTPEALTGKVFILITGASQGIGRQIAITLSEIVDKNSQILLIARNENGLKETRDKLSKNINVNYASVDLGVATDEQLTEIISNVTDVDKFDRAILIQNAGSVGDVTKNTAQMNDMDYWKNYFALNVFSTAILNSVFMKLFNDNVKAKKYIINISSLMGIKPFKSMGYYGSGKAAREMYFKVFAEEFPQVNVLNYSPGPVETEMLVTVATKAGDDEVRNTINDTRIQKKSLTPEQTVNRLVNILRDQKYKSGDHVDYFDEFLKF